MVLTQRERQGRKGGGGGPFLSSSGLVKTIQYIRISMVS